MVQDQPDLARVRAEAAAVNDDRGHRFHGKLPAHCAQTEVIRRGLEFRSLPRDERMVAENELGDEPLRSVQLLRCIWIIQPLQLKLGQENSLPATSLLQSCKTFLQLL